MNRLASMLLVACFPFLVLAATPPMSTERLNAAGLERTKIVVAVYPKLALDNAVEGRVLMNFTILPDGSTADIEVVESDPAGVFDESAVRALSQWRYEPIVRDGKAVAQLAKVNVKFSL